MINNKAKNIYHQIRLLKDRMPKEDNKVSKKGLLSPVKNMMSNKQTKEKQPINIVYDSWFLLNNTREELNGKDDTEL